MQNKCEIKNYTPPQKDLWQGRQTEGATDYFYQMVKLLDLDNYNQNLDKAKEKRSIALIGFCCDAGIERNQGRLGAKQGPDAIRTQLAKLAWHFPNSELYDFGNIVCYEDELEIAQENLGQIVALALNHGFLPIVLGGGHETAWGHYQGIRKAFPEKNLSIINFDAHFDLRELTNDKGNSGTPFLQIAHDSKNNDLPFNYMVLGVQQAANTKPLFDTANSLDVNYLFAEEIFNLPLKKQKQYIAEFLKKSEGIYLTFCLDVMAAAVAPGVSAPQSNGLLPQHVWSLLQFIVQQKKLISFDIVELSPVLDNKDQTAQLAARLIFEVIKNFSS